MSSAGRPELARQSNNKTTKAKEQRVDDESQSAPLMVVSGIPSEAVLVL